MIQYIVLHKFFVVSLKYCLILTSHSFLSKYTTSHNWKQIQMALWRFITSTIYFNRTLSQGNLGNYVATILHYSHGLYGGASHVLLHASIVMMLVSYAGRHIKTSNILRVFHIYKR